MGFLGLPDVTPQFVDDAASTVGGVIDDGAGAVSGGVEDGVSGLVAGGDYVVDKAGDGLRMLASIPVKTAEGLWDIAKDGYNLVMDAVHECMRWLWNQVPEFIRHPFGDAGPLEEAAAAWRVVIGDIERTRDGLVAGGRSLQQWKGPAAERFDTYLNGLLNDTSKLGDGVERIAKALTDAAEALKALNRLVHSVLAEIAAYIVVDVILTLLTGGGGAAAAAAEVASMVARVTSAIRRAVQLVRRVLPILREAKALRSIERVTTRTDDVFDAFKTGKTVKKVDRAIDGLKVKVKPGTPWEATRGDLVKKWLSTGIGNGVGVSVATGKDPSKWGAKEALSVGLGTVVSVRLGTFLKPLWQRTKGGPDGVLAAATTSSASGGLSDSGVQILTTGKVDLHRSATAAVTSGLASGAARSATFAAHGQGPLGRPISERGLLPRPNNGERASHVKLTETEKGLGRMGEGLTKGGVRQVIAPGGPTGPAARSGSPKRQPQFHDVPKHLFGRPTYTVRPGDNLTVIAAALLGDGDRWPELVNGTHPAISDPDIIRPGQTISLPR